MMLIKNQKLKKILLVLSIVIGVSFLLFFGFVIYTYNKYTLDINKLTSLNNGIRVYSSLADSSLYNTNRSIIEIETLPNYVKNAFIDIEDKRFYSHNGYDLKRIVKSALVNLTTKSKSQGASTISQQLIKNALLSNEKTYSRKIKEIVLSVKMEKEFTKDEILEMYLNTIYFGNNAYGIENASNIYFNKSAKDLTINEACCLAGMIKSPKNYSPLTHYDNAISRRNLVAKNMLKSGNITQIDYEEVINSPILLSNKETDNSYECEAIYEACKLLNISERELINRNYKIVTFKQDDLQQQLISANNEVVSAYENKENTSLDSLSIVANSDGQILAYYANSKYNLHNLKRQPASTLKPLAVYLPCFEHNILSPASVILDEEINYSGYSPKNADNKFHGYVSIRNALANSLNIPAVKALDYLGVKKSRETLEKLGINITNNDLNLSLALGCVKNGVNLLDLLAGYVTLSNLGYYTQLSFIDKILDENDKVIYSYETYKSQVLDAGACFMVNDILKDCAKSGTAKRLSDLNLPIASKTGTASNSKGNTDLYNVAYTKDYTTLTWISSIKKEILPNEMFSSAQPTNINKSIFSYLYSNKNASDWAVPNNIERCAFDLVELENNNTLIQPNHQLDRYIAYDYFKIDNLPAKAGENKQLEFDIQLNKFGTTIQFNSKRNQVYNLMKRTKNSLVCLETIKDINSANIIKDNNVFSYQEIEYYFTNENDEIISDIKKIRPKDYLINQLNNEIISSKKQWLV